MKNSILLKTFLITGIFAIAMGFLEAVVVVYLRELYYPAGFHFPLRLFSPQLYMVEIVREAATLVMLLSVGVLAGKSPVERFAFFLYGFGVWDIVYYVALKIFLDWPSGFLTWDLLFLIPVTWIGPVLAPVICSVTMIFLAVVLVTLRKKRNLSLIGIREWVVMCLGALLVFLSFIRDYTLLMLRNGFFRDMKHLFENRDFIRIIESYVPVRFDWLLFGAGEGLILLSVILIIRKHQRRSR